MEGNKAVGKVTVVVVVLWGFAIDQLVSLKLATMMSRCGAARCDALRWGLLLALCDSCHTVIGLPAPCVSALREDQNKLPRDDLLPPLFSCSAAISPSYLSFLLAGVPLHVMCRE